jgi:uncharacterized membrane protein
MKRLILSPIINIAFFGFAVAWIKNMERNKCECSQDWRREYMKCFFLAGIALQFVIMAKGVNYLHNLRVPLAIASMAYLWASISYILELRSHTCECSKSLERSILFWYSIFQVAALVIVTWMMVKA